MKLKTLEDLLVDQLKDLYSAENQLIKALPKMAKAAASRELQRGFKAHLAQTRGQATRIQKICKQMGVSPKGKKCAAMEGLIEEGKELLEFFLDAQAHAQILDGCLRFDLPPFTVLAQPPFAF